MRVWKFYLDRSKLKRNENVAFTTLREKYTLYAITNSKEKAIRFKAERNMNLFIERKGKLEKDEWIEYASRHRDCTLVMTTLTTRREKSEIEHPETIDDYVKEVDMLITYAEKDRIDNFSNNGEDLYVLPIFLNTKHLPSPNAFTSFINGVLRMLGYQMQYNFMIGYDDYAYLKDSRDDIYNTADISFGGTHKYYFDELSMFIWEYGDLYDL